jgi:hypothetical protein
MTTILWLNKETNIIDNVSIDDKPISEITLPDLYIALDQKDILGIVYEYDEEIKEVYSYEALGLGGKHFTWDGTKLIGPQPKIQGAA